MHARNACSSTARQELPRKRLLAAMLASGALFASATALADGGDNQAAATVIAVLPYNDSGTTVAKLDNYDLPPDTTSPTLTATCATIANGTGPAGSLPRGAVYTGTGTGPDAVYSLSFPVGNPDTLTITMDPGAQDLTVMVFCNTISNSLSDGLVISDTGVAGTAETVTVGNIAPGTTLYIVVDGYSTGGTPPGPSDAYTLSVTSNGATQPGGGGTPDLQLTKSDGGATTAPGGTVAYTLNYTNAGTVGAAGVVLTETVPADTTFNSGASTAGWTCLPNINAGSTCSFAVGAVAASGNGSATFAVSVAASPVGAQVSNTASIADDGTGGADPTPANNTASDTTAIVIPTADLSITKTDGAASEIPGTAVTYTIVASNAGPDPVAGATVTDTFPATLSACTWTCVGAGGGTCAASGSGNINDTVNLPAGGSATYTASCTIDAAATGTLANTATVSSSVTDPASGNNSATDTDTLEPSADLSITKTDGVATATPGGSVTYTIVASNAGPSNAPAATVADTFPATLTCTWTCAGTGGGSCAASGSGNINDTVNLPAGGSTTYTASCAISASASGSLSNTATVAEPAGINDSASANNSASDTDTLAPSADLSITKTDGVATATPGGGVTYTIVAANAGPSDATGATVADTFPAALTCTWTCAGSGSGTCTASGSGNISDTVNLPAGGSVTYTATCAISASASGSLSNTATVAAPAGVTDSVSANNSATDTDTLAPSADLSITKTDGVTTVLAGGSLTYTIVASNPGPSNATGSTVIDTFPAGLTCTWTCVGAGGGTCTASGSGNIGDTVNLPSGGSVTYTATCAVSSSTAGILSNTATVATGAGAGDPDTSDNSATDTTTVLSPANVSGTKTVSGSFLASTPLSYSIVLTNAGPAAQLDNTGDEFTDVLPASLTLVSASASSGTAVATIGTNTVAWNGSIPASGSVTIIINATINANASGSISNQGTISYDSDGDGDNDASRGTDNPATGTAADPTTFAVLSAATAIPALQWIGLILLTLLVAGVGLRQQRNA